MEDEMDINFWENLICQLSLTDPAIPDDYDENVCSTCGGYKEHSIMCIDQPNYPGLSCDRALAAGFPLADLDPDYDY